MLQLSGSKHRNRIGIGLLVVVSAVILASSWGYFRNASEERERKKIVAFIFSKRGSTDFAEIRWWKQANTGEIVGVSRRLGIKHIEKNNKSIDKLEDLVRTHPGEKELGAETNGLIKEYQELNADIRARLERESKASVVPARRLQYRLRGSSGNQEYHDEVFCELGGEMVAVPSEFLDCAKTLFPE